MAERRSLGTALQLSPESMAFVRGASPEVSPADTTAPASAVISTHPQAEAVRIPSPVRRKRTGRHARTETPETNERLLGLANLRVPLTTRLHPNTAVALKRASLEQRLHGASPATVQEIAEEAIQAWLRDSGYLE